MDFESDLAQIIKQQFDEQDIFYEDNLSVSSFAARYIEMLNRRITPIRRDVHFSEEIHESLGKLTHEKEENKREEATEAWKAVFFIRHLLTKGQNVNCFLSTGCKHATGRRSKDGLLWDFGMHHFHLSTEVEKTGFVKRSAYLLFAIFTEENAYFVDVRRHPKPGDLGWVRQDLLRIVHSNWPQLLEPKVLRGVNAPALTDAEKQELRNNNISINNATLIGDNAVAPIGGGVTKAGTSVVCQFLADKCLYEVRRHQSYLETQPAEVRSALQDKGMITNGDMGFKLVLLDSYGSSNEKIRSLQGSLHNMGLGIVEVTTGTLINLSLVE